MVSAVALGPPVPPRAGRDGLTAPGFVFERPAEAAGGLDELAGDTGSVAVLVEAVVGLAQQLAKEAGKELVERRLFGGGAVAIDPGAQAVEVLAGGVGDALAHALVERREGAQLVGAAAGGIDDLGEQLGAHGVEPRHGDGQGLADVGGGREQAPVRVRQLGEREERARGRFRLERAAGAVGRQLDAVLLEGRLQAEAEGVADKGSHDGDAAGGDVLLGDQAVDLLGRPAEHLGVEAEGVRYGERRAAVIGFTFRKVLFLKGLGLDHWLRRRGYDRVLLNAGLGAGARKARADGAGDLRHKVGHGRAT